MNIIFLIEKHIELCVRRENLDRAIKNSSDSYQYAKVEGDLAYYAKDYESEKRYNDSARYYKDEQNKAEREVAQLDQLLNISYQNYNDEVEKIDATKLSDAAMILTIKKEEAQRRIQVLSERRTWAISKGDVAFVEKNYDEEKEYNHISLECYMEIQRIKPLIYYYDKFIKDLNYRANIGKGDNFGPTGPMR